MNAVCVAQMCSMYRHINLVGTVVQNLLREVPPNAVISLKMYHTRAYFRLISHQFEVAGNMPNICEIVLQFGNCVDYNILNLHMSQIVFYLRIKKIHNNSNKNEQLN